jgi:hypothetical protein
MPQLIVAPLTTLFGGLGLTGTIAGFSTASIAAYAVVTALSLAASYALATMQKKPKQSPQQQTVKQAIPPRLLVYGRDKVGGALAFYEVYGRALYQVTAHCQGPIDAIESYWLNDVNAGASLASGAPAPWGAQLVAQSVLGTMSQPAFAPLVSASGGQWTSAHQLKGVAATLMICVSAGKNNAKVWPNGVPALRVVMRGQADIYDPRDGGTRWTENAALIIRDYLTRRVGVTIAGEARTVPVGFGIAPAMIDEASFAAFANLCDEPVALAAGGTEPRYRISATIDLATAEPRTTLAALLRACDAEIYPTATGLIAIRGGAWATPTVAIGDDDVLQYDYANGSGRAAAFNRLKITYKDRTDYQPAECDPWEDLADQAERGVLQQDFDAQIVPSFTQARRVARIFSAKSNPRHRLTLTLAYGSALRLWGERNFALTLPELGLDAEPMAVGKISLDLDTMTGVVECASDDPAAYDWSTTLEGAPPSTIASSSSAAAIPAADGLVVDVDRTAVMAGVQIARLVASLPTLTTADGARFEYRKSGATDWIVMTGRGAFAGVSEALEDGATYEARGAYVRNVGYSAEPDVGEWSSTASVTVVANATPPASSGSSLGASPATGLDIAVSWQTPAVADFAYTRIYLGPTDTFADASPVAVSYAPAASSPTVTVAASAAGTWRVFVRTFNGSGVGAAAPLGPVSVTV